MYKVTLIVASLFLITFCTELSFSGQIGGSTIVVQKRFSGTLAEFAPNGAAISVMKMINDRETRMTFATDFNTKVTSRDQTKKLSDLKVGDKVTVVYVRSGKTFSAKSILIEN